MLNQSVKKFWKKLPRLCLIGMVGIMPSINKVAGQGFESLYEAKVFTHKGKTLPYRIMYPKNFNPEQKYPLVIFLHGSGERGNDNQKQLVHGASLFANDSVRSRFPAIVVFPQCPEDDFWANIKENPNQQGYRSIEFLPESKPTAAMDLLIRLVNGLKRESYVDSRRIYVGGLSMGGMGTFELVARIPKVFAAAFPICGGSNPESAKRYAHKVKFWVFHGAKDDVVPPQYSIDMVSSIRKLGGDARLTIYPDAGHNSWDQAFREPELLLWLFSCKK